MLNVIFGDVSFWHKVGLNGKSHKGLKSQKRISEMKKERTLVWYTTLKWVDIWFGEYFEQSYVQF